MSIRRTEARAGVERIGSALAEALVRKEARVHRRIEAARDMSEILELAWTLAKRNDRVGFRLLEAKANELLGRARTCGVLEALTASEAEPEAEA